MAAFCDAPPGKDEPVTLSLMIAMSRNWKDDLAALAHHLVPSRPSTGRELVDERGDDKGQGAQSILDALIGKMTILHILFSICCWRFRRGAWCTALARFPRWKRF